MVTAATEPASRGESDNNAGGRPAKYNSSNGRARKAMMTYCPNGRSGWLLLRFSLRVQYLPLRNRDTGYVVTYLQVT